MERPSASLQKVFFCLWGHTDIPVLEVVLTPLWGSYSVAVVSLVFAFFPTLAFALLISTSAFAAKSAYSG